MTCKIESLSQEIHIDFWNNYDINYEQKKGNGFFVEIDHSIYIITCFHIIAKNNMKIYAIFTNNNINITKELKVLRIIQEIDIAILIFKEKYKPEKFYKESELNTKLLFTNNIKNLLVVHPFFPKLPLIEYQERDKNIDIFGLSGTLIFDDKIPIGMIFKKDTNILALPLTVIMPIITKIINDRHITFSFIIFKSKCANIEISNADITGKFNAHYVIDNYNLKYFCNTEYFNFNCGDLIIEINNKLIENNGCIYYEPYNCNIMIDTYMMLCCLFNNNCVNIKLIRNEKPINITIQGKPHNKIYSINIMSSPFLYYNEFIFVELSYELIKYFNKNNIIINCNYIDPTRKYVIIVRHNLKNIDTPIMILNQIDNFDIKNIASLKYVLKKPTTQIVYKCSDLMNKIINIEYNKIIG